MSSVTNRLTLLTLFFAPLLFWTLTPNFFATPKQLLLLVAALCLLVLSTIRAFTTNRLPLSSSPLNLSLILFLLALLLNLVVVAEGRPEAIVGRGSLYLSAATFSLLLAGFSSPSLKQSALAGLLGGGTLLALYSILQLTLLHTLPALPALLQPKSFSPAGNPLAALSLLVLTLTVSISWLSAHKSPLRKALLLFTVAVTTIAAVAYLSLMLDGRELAPRHLPLTASWGVALDALKGGRNLLFGVGLANFSSFFTTVKPLSLNQGLLWNTLPTSSGSELLQLLTTGGLTLALPFAYLLFFALKRLTASSSPTLRSLHLGLFVSAVFLILAPASAPLVIIFFALLGVTAPTPSSTPLAVKLRLPLALSIAAAIALILFFSGRVVLAESHLRRAQQALASQNSQAVYQHHLAAISLMPGITNYHLSYSQVNLQLASALSQKPDLSEDDRRAITQLLSQSVREARLATSLRPNLASTWNNLGFIYRQLINVAEGAEKQALDHYALAVRLDPANPALRVEYGGLYYQLAQAAEDDPSTFRNLINSAIQEFRLATSLKPDYANGWYNLSRAYEAGGELTLAYQAMQQTVASLEPESQDLTTATSELATLKSRLPSPSPSPSAPSTPSASSPPTISEPEPLPSPLPGGPIELDSSPSPTPSPKP